MAIVVTVMIVPAVAQQELAEINRLLAAGKSAEARERAEKAVETYPDASMAWFLLARARHASGDLEGAIEAGRKAVEFPGVRASSYYNLACAYALLGRKDDAFEALEQAKRAGFANRTLMRTDPDLDSIRDDPRFVLPVERRFEVLDVGDSRGLPYSLDLPPDFDPDATYPVLVGPGDAEPHPDEPGSLYWGEDAVARGWIVVETPAFIMDDAVEKARKLLDFIESKYHIEGGKFHLAGFSTNSVGVFEVAMAMPERFHTVTVVPGFPVVENESELAKLQGVTVNVIVGENDTLWLDEARLLHDRLRRLGVRSYLEVVPNGGHILEGMFGGELMNRLDALRVGNR
jgi:predicted esterase